MDNTIVIYHKDCQDGTASCAAYKYLHPMTDAVFIPCSHSEKGSFNFNQLEGKNVVVLDFSFDLEQTLHIKSIANSFLNLDHHDSAFKELGSVEGFIFAPNESGATLTWKHFSDNAVPMFLQLIRANDIWDFSKHGKKLSQEFQAGLSHFNNDIVQYVELLHDSSLGENGRIKTICENGSVLLGQLERMAKTLASRYSGEFIEIEKVEIPVVNVNSEELAGRVSMLLAEGSPEKVGGAYYFTNTGIHFSFRGLESSDIHLGEMMQRFQSTNKLIRGGGHAKAAGMSMQSVNVNIANNYKLIQLDK